MPQLCLYVDDATMKTLRSDAELANKSLSRYVLDELKEKRDAGGWPAGWFGLYGSLAEEDGFELPEDEPIDFGTIDALEAK